MELVVNEKKWTEYGILINTTQPAKKKNHMGYKVYQLENFVLRLCEVVEVWYPHPDAPDDAFIPQIQFIKIGEFSEGSPIYPALNLMLHADKNIQNSVRNL